MVSTATTGDIVAPICVIPVARGIDLCHKLGQVAGIIDTVDLLVGSRGSRGDVCVGAFVVGRGEGASGAVGMGGGVGRVGSAEGKGRLREGTGAHVGAAQVVCVAAGACGGVRVVLEVAGAGSGERGSGLVPVG